MRRWPVDQNDRQADFGAPPRAWGAVAAPPLFLVTSTSMAWRRISASSATAANGPPRRDPFRAWQIHVGGVDRAHEIAMLRGAGEGGELKPADCQEHPPRSRAQCGDGSGDVRHLAPVVTRSRPPLRPADDDERAARLRRRGPGVGRDRRRERVRCIHQHVDAFLLETGCKPVDAAEAADPRRQRLRSGRFGAPGERHRRLDIGATGEHPRKRRRLAGAAENQHAAWGGGMR